LNPTIETLIYPNTKDTRFIWTSSNKWKSNTQCKPKLPTPTS